VIATWSFDCLGRIAGQEHGMAAIAQVGDTGFRD